MNNDPKNSVGFSSTVKPQVITATGAANGAAVNTQGARWARLVGYVGAMTGTSPTCDIKLQASADGSTGWTDVPNAVVAQITQANDDRKVLGLLDMRKAVTGQYLRAVVTVGGTSPNVPIFLGIELMGGPDFSLLTESHDFEVISGS